MPQPKLNVVLDFKKKMGLTSHYLEFTIWLILGYLAPKETRRGGEEMLRQNVPLKVFLAQPATRTTEDFIRKPDLMEVPGQFFRRFR